MTNQNCQYLPICRQWDCRFEHIQACSIYQRIENEQIDVAVQFYIDMNLTSEDWIWVAQHFSVPLGKLERKLIGIRR